VQRGEVEAEDVARRLDGIGSLARFDGDVAEHAHLGGVRDARNLADRVGHGNGSENDCRRVPVDGVVGGLLRDRRLAVLFELPEDLLANEGAERDGAAQNVRAGVVDRRKHEGGRIDRRDGTGEERRLGTLRRGRCISRGACACGIRHEASRVEVRHVQRRVVEAPGYVRIGRSGALRLSRNADRNADEESKGNCRRTKHHADIVALGTGLGNACEARYTRKNERKK
jgi:hypothetical protein